jgi:hypothetical protein
MQGFSAELLRFARGADVPGAVLVVSALMLAVHTIVESTEYGLGSLRTLGLAVVTVGLFIIFADREARTPNPLMRLHTFRSRIVAGANLILALVETGVSAVFFLGALYLQDVLGFDTMQVGLAFLPVALGIWALALGLADRLIVRFGAQLALAPALGLMAVALVIFQRVPVDGDYVRDLLPVMVLLGVGAGIAYPARMTLAMSGATASDAGLASGLVNTTERVGAALGLALLGTLSTMRTSSLLETGQSPAGALTGGYQLAFGVSAVLLVGAIARTATLLRPERDVRATAPNAGRPHAGSRGSRHRGRGVTVVGVP